MIQLNNQGDITYSGGIYNFDRFLYNIPNTNDIVDGTGKIIINNDTIGKIINTPTIVSPVQDIINYTGIVTSSPMSIYSSVYTGVHTSSDWEVATDVNFTNIVYSSYHDTVNLTTLPVYIAAPNTSYYIRVRYNSNSYTSLWSTPLHYTTSSSYITAPTITTDASTITPVITLTNISVVGAGNTHTSTDWIVATDSSFHNIVYSSLKDTVNLTSLTITQALNTAAIYYVTVRVHTATLTSSYSTTSYVTINALPTPTVTLASTVIEGNTIPGTITNYDAANTYNITVDVGTITNISGGTFTYAPGMVNADIHATVSVVANNSLIASSAPATLDVLVTNIPYVTDGLIINNNFSTNSLIDIGYQVP